MRIVKRLKSYELITFDNFIFTKETVQVRLG